jgi:P27 family predicted phage terminase small subunit
MRRGPPPTPTHLKVIRGNPGKRPLPRGEPQPQIPDDVPSPPPYLEGYAADEWLERAPELYRLGLLTTVDLAPFAAYCQSYHWWRTALEALRTMGERDALTAGLMVRAGTGGAVQNPLFLTMRQSAQDMLRYAGEFGLTPAARARLSASGFDPPPSDGKFDGLLA